MARIIGVFMKLYVAKGPGWKGEEQEVLRRTDRLFAVIQHEFLRKRHL
jgi:hypothetical protein